MPTFNDPAAVAEEARQAMRGLAHASQRIDDPDVLYGVAGELLGTLRSLEQSLIQLSGACLTYQGRAAHDDGDRNLGAADAWAAADALAQAARHISGAEALLDQASGHLGRIAWQPPLRQWVSVVFLQGEEADRVLDLIDQDGTEAAMEHLRGFDYGEETTSAALVNGHVYDEPPTGMSEQRVNDGAYALVYSRAFGHVALYREHDPASETTTASTATEMTGTGPVQDAATAEDVQRALEERRDRVRGDGSWFTPDRIAQIKRDRGLGR
ncbi:hypothetical protein brsh051_11360 [Brooklawnia propionicigenes]|uniref:Uncharacterized protein n=1 Tax=Brooklawnia propionicigenes TaxID=3041175 RepID=A0AAN0K6G8_9ACTN|nr:hypothetical protein [Brooklawnia sp. SH051]BEH01855.1 hypothetical protein brsh051_11360 [Brooklawnia sp. SH051]